MGAKEKPRKYTPQEIAKLLNHLDGVFHEVRLVDPKACKELYVNRYGQIAVGDDCFSKWFGCDRCDNCISERALESGETLEKYELLGDTIYWTVSKPVVLKRGKIDIECVVEGMFSSSVAEYAKKLGSNPAVDKALLDERGFYIDWSTKAYNRRYFDEGIYLSYLNQKPSIDIGMAVFKVSGEQDLVEAFGADNREVIFRQLALLIGSRIGARDILVRMADDSLLVIMLGATRESTQDVVSHIENEVASVLQAENRGVTLQLSSGIAWASPFERTDQHARALFREAEENAYLDRRGVRKEWDEFDETWKFSVEDAMSASASSGASAERSSNGKSQMATASDLADILDDSPETAHDPLVIWLREFAKKGRSRPPEKFRFPMPIMGSMFVPGNVQSVIDKMEDTTLAALAKVELEYLRGNFKLAAQETKSLMEPPNDLSVRVTAGLLNSMATMASGPPSLARQAKRSTEVLCESGIRSSQNPRTRAACAIVDSTIVTLFAEHRSSYAPISEAISQLPEGQRLYAGYLIALQAFNLEEYGNALGVINSALTFSSDTYPVPLAYLHVLAACSYMALRRPQEGAEELAIARQLTAADEIVSPFVENYMRLQGLLDSSMKKSELQLYRSISGAAERYRMGWISIVDPDQAAILAPSPLTASEMTIASLAARGWTNREISQHINLSENTVKHRLSSVFQKMGIGKRSELAGKWLG